MNSSGCGHSAIAWAVVLALNVGVGPRSIRDVAAQTESVAPAVVAPEQPVVQERSESILGRAIVDPPQTRAVATNTKEQQIRDLKHLFEAQSKELDAQRGRVAKQQQAIDEQQTQIDEQNKQIDGQQAMLQAMQTQIDQLATGLDKGRTDAEIKFRERLKSLEETVAEIPESAEPDKDFTGSILVPGTNAALRIGGFAKMNVIDSFDAIGSSNRFRAGAIPVSGEPGSEADGHFVVSAEQTRLNLEMREKSSYGDFRAFVEADFAGSGETIRLRHAFGQFRSLLAGQTWSTMVDTEGAPEEVGFDDITGRIKVRQAQLRYFPSFGRENTLIFALEDPAPDVEGGSDNSQWPDAIISVERSWTRFGRTKASVLLRQIGIASISDPKIDQKEFGWGLSLSNYVRLPVGNAHDRISVQLNYGDGLGRYINDLAAVRGQDGVLNPLTGELETLGVFSGYISAKHWWNEAIRSTVTYTWVNIANKGFQPGNAYDSTQRISMNVLWSPTPRIDVGGEFIWGERVNKDGRSGKAKQLQFATKYRF